MCSCQMALVWMIPTAAPKVKSQAGTYLGSPQGEAGGNGDGDCETAIVKRQ
jgi:hypothetical protein